MARRTVPLVTGEIYHLFNRSIARQPILTKVKDFQRFFNVTDFYRFENPPMRFSHYNRLPIEQKRSILDTLYKTGERLVEIYTFSLMPNHFHLLVKQLKDNGIKILVSQIQNSYAKYYNTKYKRQGALFQEMFKAVRIETDEQFIHVARYIHLNPLTSFIIKEIEELEEYSLTSFIDYIGKRQSPFLNKNKLLGSFSNVQQLKKFTLDQVDSQRKLKNIQHLFFE